MSEAAQDGSALDVLKANVAANVDAYGKGGVDLSLDTEKIQAEGGMVIEPEGRRVTVSESE